MDITISLTLIIALSLISQWIALRVGWPPILLYLLLGLGLGPIYGVVQPDVLLGDLLFPFCTTKCSDHTV